MGSKTITYTKTDEAPALATQSFLPIVKAFAKHGRVDFELKDISLAGRLISQFPESLSTDQKIPDALAELGVMVKKSEANVIKLPNISASIPQLKAAIKELQSQGYKIPNFPEDPQTDEEITLRKGFSKLLGSAVNPVLREGNSDRRVAPPVKQYAKDNPHYMGEWSKDSKSHIAHMTKGDFYSSEKSAVAKTDTTFKIILETGSDTLTLKEPTPLLAGEVIDSSLMSVKALRDYFDKEINEAKKDDLLLSLHLKATMMKVSDPIIFGHAVSIYYKELFEKFSADFEELGVNLNNGIGDVYSKIQKLSADKQSEIKSFISSIYEKRPRLAMVDSDKGITNLHVPSHVIIDASVPAALRSSGKMWGPDGKLHDTKALIPDRCYAGIYQEVISFCKANGAFDVKTMGNVSNVGLMAKKAEEYGSHDKTFEVPHKGTIKVLDKSGNTFFEHSVEQGDIWRMCQTKDEPVKDWVRLAVKRAKATGAPAVFWLDKDRAHDANLIDKVNTYLQDHDTSGVEIKILSPVKAMAYTLDKVKAGTDVISVTGNVLRDYLTDLFPILELGTSAKMLSIVPLLAGGGLFETGAGGSAPKHVEQFQTEGHLRWDSLGEFLALSVSLEDLGEKADDKTILLLAKTLSEATSKHLKENKSPSRKVGELDTRGSHFYLAYFWAEALANQNEDSKIKEKFSSVFKEMQTNESTIVDEFKNAQGSAVEMGGYFNPNMDMIAKAMRPSSTFNSILSKV